MNTFLYGAGESINKEEILHLLMTYLRSVLDILLTWLT